MMRPVFEMLAAMQGRASFHMPGHKGEAPFGAVDLYALDTTELPVTDDLYCAEHGLAEAQRLYAQCAGAGATLLMHNGSTGGVHVMLQLYAGEGDTVLLPRNAHLSATNACAMGGLHAVWMPVTQQADGYCYVAEETVLAALDAHPEAKALLLTRPDYYGCCMPMARIVEKAHAMGVHVVVDEAHGAHFPWLEGVPSAGEMGVDAWTQSVHKTLPGLTASAVLHLRDAGDADKALRILRRTQTSSPSFLLMLSIDDARAWMELHGRERLAAITDAAEALRSRLPALGYADAHAAWREAGMLTDPTRLVIEAPQGGHALADALAERGMDVEMADQRRVVVILTAMSDAQDVARLEAALAEIHPRAVVLPTLPDVTALPHRAMEVRHAVMADVELVPLDHAAGRIAAQSLGLYPPGIPQVCPGEIIPESVVRMLRAAGSQQRFGVEGDSILCVKQ